MKVEGVYVSGISGKSFQTQDSTIDEASACPFSVFFNNAAAERGEAATECHVAEPALSLSLLLYPPFQRGVLFLRCECAKLRHPSFPSLHAFPRTHVLGNTSW